MLDLEKNHQPTLSSPISHQNCGAINIGVLGSNKPYNRNDLQFRAESKAVEDESGICSPPLWSRSPQKSPRENHYQSLSPASKTRAIERGQRELMEMVRSMPESNYELTLKDLVEHQQQQKVGEEENKVGEKGKNLQKREKGNRKVDQVKRTGNIDSGGFYLKMAFPISFGSKQKKNKNNKKKEQLVNNKSSKVSPRTSSVADGSASADKDWWKKKSLSGSGGESESGVSSINSGSMKSSGSTNSTRSSSSRSNSRHEMSASSCWPFIRRPESLSQK